MTDTIKRSYEPNSPQNTLLKELKEREHELEHARSSAQSATQRVERLEKEIVSFRAALNALDTIEASAS